MIKPHEMAKRLNVTVKTLQRWDYSGILTAKRTPTNRRYYTEEQYLEYIGEGKTQNRKHVAYARVSNAGQKGALKHQVAFLRSYANGKGIILDDVITDIGSGLDYRRKKWNALLEEVLDSQIDTIYVAFKDRFVRFGYEWFERLCMAFGTNIVVLNNPDLSPREEIVEDLAAVMHVFSSRIHGLEKYKKQIEGDKSIAGALKADSETKAEG